MTRKTHSAVPTPAFWDDIATAFGPVRIAIDADGALVRIHLDDRATGGRRDRTACRHVSAQLHEYFARERARFELELAPSGTPFQRAVWTALLSIPYGEVRTYGEIARQIGKPHAARAVGQANGANPIPIVIPCHRVIAGDRTIGGFSGGLGIKRHLLRLEGVAIAA
jgi:methylated-DNA-[protein]-cysteine S-methyltransferase